MRSVPTARLLLAGWALFVAASGALATVAAPVVANGGDDRIDVVAFNVLAPIWAGPQFYPADLDPATLEAGARRERVAALLRERAATAEVVALQEVQASELATFAAALGPEFVGTMSTNAPEWWSAWLTPGVPWQPNGTALFVRQSAFANPRFTELELADGNSMSLVTARHVATGRVVRVASVHLDSDRQPARASEFGQLLALWGTPVGGGLDIVAGDFNEDVVNGSVAGIASRKGFVSVLAEIGNREPTHPFRDSYNRSPKWGIIDHVVVRNGQPLAGDVLDGGLWSIADETARIAENLRRTGSDHFAVVASVRP